MKRGGKGKEKKKRRKEIFGEKENCTYHKQNK
jgi:hypothetical protein